MAEDLRHRLDNLYSDYAAGRLDEVARAFDRDVDFVSYAPADVFPYLGHHHGSAELAKSMAAAHREFEYLVYKPVFMVVERDDAAVIVFARVRQRSSGRIIQLFVADFLRLREERIVGVREFMDSFDAVQQMLGRELQIGNT